MSSPHLVVATAGHIDHGKTALVKALTGIETDRLEEEKRRGITIDLGFAHLADSIAIIDVPGHERFIKTMVAGVSTVDLGLLVVAVDDGVMPQTREHLAILKLLGVPRIFVVLTKIAGTDTAWVDLVEEDVRAILPEEYAESSCFFRCDSLSGEGIEDLKQELLGLVGDRAGRTDSGIFRLPVDRAFSLRGFGTVVAGTVLSGRVKVGDRLMIMPVGSEVRVRGLQSQGLDQSEVGIGQRAAMNLIGERAGLVQRGDWICEPGSFLPTEAISVAVQTLWDAPVLKNRDRVHLHVGTAEVLGRIVLFGADIVHPGGDSFAQIILESQTIAARGDRFVIRRYSPLETLGGGVILDPLAVRSRRSDPEALAFMEVLSRANSSEALVAKIKSCENVGMSWREARSFCAITHTELEAMVTRLAEGGAVVRLGTGDNARLFSTEAFHNSSQGMLIHIEDYHRRNPHHQGITRAQLISELAVIFPQALVELALDSLLQKGDLILERGYFHRPGHRIQLTPELETLALDLQRRLEDAGFNPPSTESLAKSSKVSEADYLRVVNTLILQGKVARLENGTLWATKVLRDAWRIIRTALTGGESKSTGQLRDALGCPRHPAVTLLEHFDALGFTFRREDLRAPGPKFDEPFQHSETKNT